VVERATSFFRSVVIAIVAVGLTQPANARRDGLTEAQHELVLEFLAAVKGTGSFASGFMLQAPSGDELAALDFLKACKSDTAHPGDNNTIMIPWKCKGDKGEFGKMTMLHLQNGKVAQISLHDYSHDPHMHYVNG
jgi:hypothetical protein